jgi:hypothetical protein
MAIINEIIRKRAEETNKRGKMTKRAHGFKIKSNYYKNSMLLNLII